MSTTPDATNIVITNDEVIVPFEIAPGVNADRKINIKDFFLNFSSQAAIDTEIMPVSGTGLLALRQLGKYRQIVFQIETGVTTVVWGKHERDSQAISYEVASPYRVIIADIFDGDLLGARMFYSPKPISSPTDPLYNINLPNVNCRGYGTNNAVGWLCLYLRESWKELTLVQQILAINERAGGGEAYNDRNMDETDGTRYYMQYREDRPEFYEPDRWEAKTKSDGIDWVNDVDLLLPVYVKNENNQHKNFATINKDGVYEPEMVPDHKDPQTNNWVNKPAMVLTIDMAMRGSYSAYYTDDERVKPINVFTNPEPDGSAKPINYRSIIERSIVMPLSYGVTARERPIVKNNDQWNFGSSWTSGSIDTRTQQVKESHENITFAPKKIGTCAFTKEPIYELTDYVIVSNYGWVIKESYDNNLDLFVDINYFNEDYQNFNGIYHIENVKEFVVKDPNSMWYNQKIHIAKNKFDTNKCRNCGDEHVLHEQIINSLGLTRHPFVSNEKYFDAYCINCSDLVRCEYTGSFVPQQDLVDVEAFDPIENKYVVYSISKVSLVNLDKCACDKIVDNSTQYAELQGLGKVCTSCINIVDNGIVNYVPVNKK